ncbi:hypothetical protein ACX80V_13690 [Arthrobacter sp. MDT3-24]
MNMPALEALVSQLESVSGAQQIDPEVPLMQIPDVDSMDLMEWLYSFQNDFPEVKADATLFENEDGKTTLKLVHERLMALDTVVSA